MSIRELFRDLVPSAILTLNGHSGVTVFHVLTVENEQQEVIPLAVMSVSNFVRHWRLTDYVNPLFANWDGAQFIGLVVDDGAFLMPILRNLQAIGAENHA
jgi:hypothetical protein